METIHHITEYDRISYKAQELAYAYKKILISMVILTDQEILLEVITEGNEGQRIEAREALAALLSTTLMACISF